MRVVVDTDAWLGRYGNLIYEVTVWYAAPPFNTKIGLS